MEENKKTVSADDEGERKAKKLTVNKKALLKTLVIVVAAFVVYKLIRIFGIQKLDVSPITDLFLGEITFLVCVIPATLAAGKIWALKLTRKGFGTGILVGLWFFLHPLLSVFFRVIMGSTGGVTVSALQIVMFFLGLLLIGINEELLFRGVLLNGMLEAFGEDSPAHIRIAVIVSGVVFGLIHIFNVFSGGAFVGALIQAVCNMASGILFGTVYIRSRKNLWPGLLAHVWLDGCVMIASGALAGMDFNSSVTDLSVGSLVIGAIELVIAVFALRRKKLLPLVKSV